MKNRKLLSVVLSVSMFLGTAGTSLTAFAENAGVFESPLAPLVRKEFTGKTFVAKPLVILMDFPDYKHEQLDTKESAFRINSFKGSETTKEFYQNLFFGKEAYKTSDDKEHITVRKFFQQESGGVYDFDGTVAGWYMAKNNAAFYGKGDTDQVQCRDFLVKEAIEVAGKDFDLSKFDVEDKWDLDGDGDYNEPDGIIDSIVVIHPGLGEEWGGGSLGEDAIWPFRWGYNMFGEDDDVMTPVQKKAIIAKNPTVTDKTGKNYSLEDFTVFEQDLPVDLFCHEFGHVLGLPDLYDVGTWSDIPVENWSIMGGSYTGDPRGSQPVSYGAYCKQFLQKDFLKRKRIDANWQNGIELNIKDIPKNGLDVTLDQTSLKGQNKDAVRINLPPKLDKLVAQPIPNKHGKKFFFSGAADNLENYMTTKAPIDLAGSANPKLSINTWYDIDPLYDFATVQVKAVGTEKWICLKDTKGLVTDKVDPGLTEGKWKETEEELLHRNPGWSFTGLIPGNDWTDIDFDLSEYKGKKIDVRFRLATDTNTPQYGFYFDNFKVSDGTKVIFFDDAEGEEKFNFDGFYVSDGYDKVKSDHYYLLEWRNKDNGLVDQGLGCVNIAAPGVVFDAGMVMWYINERYNGFTPDQNVQNHPGEAYAMVIDADQSPVVYKYVDGRTGPDRINYQMHDAAFSLRKDSPLLLTGGSGTGAYTVADEHLFMNPNFNDANDYSDDRGSYKAGVVLQQYGLQVFVTEESKNSSTAKIHIANKQEKATKQVQKEIKEVKVEGSNVEVTTTKQFVNKAYAVVVKGTEKDEIELEYKNGKYVGKTKLSGATTLAFIILEDSEGTVKSIYNSAVNGVYGVDFANISLVDEEVDASALVDKIAAAKLLVKDIVVSDNGEKLSKGTKYSSKASLDTINGVIKQSENILLGKFTEGMITEGVAALTTAMGTFEKSIKVAVGEVIVDKDEDKIDKISLTKAIKNGDALLKDLKVSLDKKGMTNKVNFWLQKDYDQFVKVLTGGKATLASDKSTQANIDTATTELIAATKLFEGAKQASTPATMDNTNAGLYGLFFIISILGCVVVVKRTRKTNCRS